MQMLIIYFCQDIKKITHKWHLGWASCYLYKLTGSNLWQQSKPVFDVCKQCIVGGRVVYLYTESLRRCYDCVYGNPEAVDLSNFLV